MQNDMKERLIKLIQKSVGGCARRWAEVVAENLIANGTIFPPCKVGDTVYTLGHGNSKHPKEWEVIGFWISADPNCNCMHISWYKDSNNFETKSVDFNEIGKTVFLIKEEAEKALTQKAGGCIG